MYLLQGEALSYLEAVVSPDRVTKSTSRKESKRSAGCRAQPNDGKANTDARTYVGNDICISQFSSRHHRPSSFFLSSPVPSFSVGSGGRSHHPALAKAIENTPRTKGIGSNSSSGSGNPSCLPVDAGESVQTPTTADTEERRGRGGCTHLEILFPLRIPQLIDVGTPERMQAGHGLSDHSLLAERGPRTRAKSFARRPGSRGSW